jgi:uncharacterized protein involved in exopolysaccharide biosynthesis
MQLTEKQIELIELLIAQQIKRAMYQSFVVNNEQAEQQESMQTVLNQTLDIEITKKALRMLE